MKQNILIAALSLVVFSVSAQSISGKINMPKGQKLEEVSTTKANTTMEMMGNNMETKMETIATNSIELKEAGANYIFGNTIKRFQMNISMMGQNQKVDTDNKEDMKGPMGQGMKAIIGKSQEITVDKQGYIKSVKFADAAAEEAVKAVNSIQNSLMVGAPFGVISALGGKSLKIGDSWVEKINTDGLKSETTFTLKSINGGDATLSFTGTTAVKNKVEQQGMEMLMDLKGGVTGVMVVEVATGLVKKRTTNTDTKGSMDMMGQKVPMKIKGVTESVVSKK